MERKVEYLARAMRIREDAFKLWDDMEQDSDVSWGLGMMVSDAVDDLDKALEVLGRGIIS